MCGPLQLRQLVLALAEQSARQDPYILRNHLGSLECRLCLTLHTNEGSYLAHTQGKKHQTNLARRAAKDMKETQLMIAPAPAANVQRKQFVKIGRPGYRVTKIREKIEYDALGNVVPAGSPQAVTMSSREGMMVCVHLPHIKEGVLPRKRFMSAWEQKKEPPNRAFQYLIVSNRVLRLASSRSAETLLPERSLRNPMRQSLSAFPLGKSRVKWMMIQLTIGRTGTLTLSSTSSSSCSGDLLINLPPPFTTCILTQLPLVISLVFPTRCADIGSIHNGRAFNTRTALPHITAQLEADLAPRQWKYHWLPFLLRLCVEGPRRQQTSSLIPVIIFILA